MLDWEVDRMEQLSRMKKYESLRKSIEMDNSIDPVQPNHRIQDSEQLLKSFDSSIFKKAGKPAQGLQGKRVKQPDLQVDDDQNKDVDTFKNEYFDDLFKEVRDYNKHKGNNTSVDNDVDILYQLHPNNVSKRSLYVQSIDDTQETLDQNEVQQAIANEVKNLAQQDPLEDISLSPFETTSKSAEATQEILRTINENVQIPSVNEHLEDVSDTLEMNIDKKELLKQEDLLREQMNEVEDEEGSEKEEKHHPILLNFILAVLIIVIIALLGLVGYGIWKAGGFAL